MKKYLSIIALLFIASVAGAQVSSYRIVGYSEQATGGEFQGIENHGTILLNDTDGIMTINDKDGTFKFSYRDVIKDEDDPTIVYCWLTNLSNAKEQQLTMTVAEDGTLQFLIYWENLITCYLLEEL